MFEDAAAKMLEAKKYRIADICFAYNNHALIDLLKKRGAAIKSLNFDLMRTLEKQIDELKS